MRPIAALAVSLLIAGCAAAPPGGEPAIRLTATLTSPTDISLAWQGTEPDTAGQVAEFATAPDGPYTVLGFLPAEQNSYTHHDLIPRTPFYYRIRPYHGRASTPVQVTLPSGPISTATDLTATITGADTIRFTWTDRTADEDGFLLETKPTGTPDFRVAAVTDPDTTTLELTTLPAESHASYRVRAFRYSQPSNVVTLTTGD